MSLFALGAVASGRTGCSYSLLLLETLLPTLTVLNYRQTCSETISAQHCYLPVLNKSCEIKCVYPLSLVNVTLGVGWPDGLSKMRQMTGSVFSSFWDLDHFEGGLSVQTPVHFYLRYLKEWWCFNRWESVSRLATSLAWICYNKNFHQPFQEK